MTPKRLRERRRSRERMRIYLECLTKNEKDRCEHIAAQHEVDLMMSQMSNVAATTRALWYEAMNSHPEGDRNG